MIRYGLSNFEYVIYAEAILSNPSKQKLLMNNINLNLLAKNTFRNTTLCNLTIAHRLFIIIQEIYLNSVDDHRNQFFLQVSLYSAKLKNIKDAEIHTMIEAIYYEMLSL